MVDDALRADSVDWDPQMVAARLDQYEEIARGLSFAGMSVFARVRRDQLRDWLDSHGWPVVYTPRRDLRLHKPTYFWSWGVVEHALAVAPRGLRLRFLLRGDEIARNIGSRLPDGAFMVLHVRAGSTYHPERDLAPAELSRAVALIDRYLPETEIWVASDRAGTEEVRSWDAASGLRFTQDLERTFTSNLAIAAAGRCFVQIRGGGITIGPAFSSEPFFVAAVPWQFSPSFKRLTGSKQIRPRWAHELSRFCAPTPEAWTGLEHFLASIAAVPASHAHTRRLSR